MSSKKEKKTSDIQKKLEEARKIRLENLAKAEKVAKADLKEDYKKEFDDFWAKSRKAYGKEKELGNVLWAHLKAIKHDRPENFEKGIKHFGLIKGDK